jgi:hypothetical protein
MGLSNIKFFKFGKLVHIIIGVVIILTVTLLLQIFSVVVEFFMINGSFGLLIFPETIIASDIFLLAFVYLPSGFLGGIYTGYKISENLRVFLFIPGLISFIILTIIAYVSGAINPSAIDLIGELLIPLLGSVIGSYLGGYTINWETEGEKPEETEEKHDLEITTI